MVSKVAEALGLYPGMTTVNRAEPAICLNVHPSSCAMALPLVQRARVRHIRATWWAWSQPEEWSWFPAYRYAGIEVMPLLHGGPEWKGIERYDALRRHYGPFRWVQLENEPDSEGASAATGERIGRYLARLSAHIRRRDPGTRICAPELGWTQPGVHDFLRGMVRAARDAFDALSIHIYGHHPAAYGSLCDGSAVAP